MSKLTQVDFAPKEMVSYCKETQTATEALTHSDQKAGTKTSKRFTLAYLKLNKNEIKPTSVVR